MKNRSEYNDYYEEMKQNQRLEAVENKFKIIKEHLEKKLKVISNILGIGVEIDKPNIDNYKINQQSQASIVHFFDRTHETNQNYKINLMRAEIPYLINLFEAIEKTLKKKSLLPQDKILFKELTHEETDIFQNFKDHSRRGFLTFNEQNNQNVRITKIDNFLTKLEEKLKDIKLILNSRLNREITDNHDIEKIVRLLELGASPSRYTIEMALIQENNELLNLIIDYSEDKYLNMPLSDGKTLLFKSVERNNIELTRELVTRGVDLNPLYQNYQYTSLYPLSLIFKIGDTPFSHAVENKYFDIASLLYENEAIIDIVNNKGNTARELIKEGTQEELEIYGDYIPQSNFVSKIPNIVSMQAGYFFGDFFIKPAIDCVNSRKHYDIFIECYIDQFDANHAFQSIKAPAITLTLHYFNPTISLAIKPVMNLFNAYSKGTFFQDFAIFLASSAMLYPVIDKDPLFRHYPFTYGLALSIVDNLLGELVISDSNT